MIGSVVFNGIIGLVTGYITNNLAIKMLFKKYLGFGGVIEETYEEFIENMSKLVERDLINSNTLKEELNTPEFSAAVMTLVKSVLQTALPRNSGHIPLGEVAEMDKTMDGIIGFLHQAEGALIPLLIKVVMTHPVQSIVSKNQFNYIVEKMIQLLSEKSSRYEPEIKGAIHSFLSAHTIGTLFSKPALTQLSDNIRKSIDCSDFSIFDKEVDDFYVQFLDIIDVDSFFGEMENQVSHMKFSDFINDADGLSSGLLKRIAAIVNTPAGEALLQEFVVAILDEMEHIYMNLDDIVDSDFKKNMHHFITNKLSFLINDVVHLIESSRSEIESIINDVVDDELRGGFFSNILRMIKDLFISNLSKKYAIINKITAIIESEGNNVGVSLAEKFFYYLKEHTIGEIVLYLRDKGLLNETLIVQMISRNIDALSNTKITMLDSLLHSEIGSVFTIDLSFVKKELLTQLFQEIKKEYLYAEGFKRDIGDIVEQKLIEMQQSYLGDYIQPNRIPVTLDKKTLAPHLFNRWDDIKDISLETIVPKVRPHSIEWHKIWLQLKTTELSTIYAFIQKDGVYHNTERAIHTLLHEHLDEMLTGNVAETVKKSLSNSEPSQIRDMVEDFMGKELVPINFFGAGLGALTGVLYAGATAFFHLPGEFVFATPILYAATGIATNLIAIKMLFKPYRGWKLLPKKSPFVGVVPAQKPIFAQNISQFVKNDMLSDEVLKKHFHTYKADLAVTIKKLVSANEYALLDTIFQDGVFLDKLTSVLYDTVELLAQKHRNELAEIIASLIQKMASEAGNKNISDMKEGILNTLYNTDFTDYITIHLKRKATGVNLTEWSSLLTTIIADNFSDIFGRLLPLIDADVIRKKVYDSSDKYDAFVESHTFYDVLGKNKTSALSTFFVKQLMSALQDGKIVDVVTDYLQHQELQPNTKLKELFDGKLYDFAKNNITHFVGLILDNVVARKAEIKREIFAEVPWYVPLSKNRIDAIVDTLLDEKLPAFIKRKSRRITQILLSVMEYRLSDFGFSEKSLNLALFKKSVVAVLQSPGVEQGAERIGQIVITTLSRLSLKSLLSVVNIHTIKDVVQLRDPLLNQGIALFKQRLIAKQDELSKIANNVIEKVVSTLSKDVLLDDLLANVAIKKEVFSLLSLLKSDEQLKDTISTLLDNFLREVFGKSDFYSESILKDDFKQFLTLFFDDNREELRSLVTPHMKDFFIQLNGNLQNGTKDHLRDIFVEASLQATECNLNTLVSAVDIKGVVEREVNHMSPQKIETMFYSFAGKYFSKLIWYGWVGGIIGLLGIVWFFVQKFIM